MKKLLIAVLLCGATIEAEVSEWDDIERAKQSTLSNYRVHAWEVKEWRIR